MAADFERRGLVGSHKAVEVYDLIQVGYEAALIAAQSWDEYEDAAFPTYAHNQIWRRMLAEIHEQGDEIPIPQYLHWYVIRHVATARERLTQELVREPYLDEIQDDEWLLEKLESYRDTRKGNHRNLIKEAVLYLDEAGIISLDETDIDVVDTDESTDPEVQAEMGLLIETMDDILSLLPADQRDVIELRFGFFDNDVWTLREVAEHLGITAEGVRKIEKRAMDRLRNDPRSRVILRNWS
jgi:RNA polymerase sigma factor (sigma-70 family)